MTNTEFKEKITAILDEALEGRVHPDFESVMQEAITDYDAGFKNNNEEGEDWKTKYSELKEKYIERFVNGSKEEETEETEETEEKKDIKTDDLFVEEE